MNNPNTISNPNNIYILLIQYNKYMKYIKSVINDIISVWMIGTKTD
jgi:hypothetical protein